MHLFEEILCKTGKISFWKFYNFCRNLKQILYLSVLQQHCLFSSDFSFEQKKSRTFFTDVNYSTSSTTVCSRSTKMARGTCFPLFVFIKYDISNSSSYARPHFPWKIPHFRGKIMFLNTNESDRKYIRFIFFRNKQKSY